MSCTCCEDSATHAVNAGAYISQQALTACAFLDPGKRKDDGRFRRLAGGREELALTDIFAGQRRLQVPLRVGDLEQEARRHQRQAHVEGRETTCPPPVLPYTCQRHPWQSRYSPSRRLMSLHILPACSGQHQRPKARATPCPHSALS